MAQTRNDAATVAGGPELPDAPEDSSPKLHRSSLARVVELWSSSWRALALLGLLYVVWWFVTAREMVAPYLIPPPGRVADTITAEWDLLLRSSYGTLYTTVLGFFWATGLGLLTAVLIVYSTTMARALYPIILFAQVIPKIAIAPILVVWFGLGYTPSIMLATLIAFFPIVISGVAGLRSIDPEHLDLAATMGAGRLRTFIKVRFPGSLPHLMSGLKVAVTLAVVGAVVGEFVGAGEGLGTLLLVASGSLNSALLFADLIFMSAIGIALFAVVELAERLLMPWHASRRTDLVTT
jgi:NitT/TauT family transport system permease protein